VTDTVAVSIRRVVDRAPLAEAAPAKLPWDDPAFGERMLREHLDQGHDRASRREPIVDAHVDWIVDELLGGRPGDVLDLGCGPGLYTERLAGRGCTCLGVDVSPASIGYARRVAADRDLACAYVLGDVRTADLGSGHDLALCVFGELNTFSRPDAVDLLGRVARSLRPGGTVLLEVHTHESVVEEGSEPAGWYTSHGGLFSDGPHLVLHEQAWEATAGTSRRRYFVLDAAGALEEYAESLIAYTDDEYRALLLEAGFTGIEVLPGLGGRRQEDMLVLVARTAADGTVSG
jgi:SAM-dependent methyltransferase